MGEFVDTALSFPVVGFTFALIIVLGFWLIVLLGASDIDALDGVGLGFAGLPGAVALSLVVVTGWFASLVATVLLDPAWPLGIAIALGALLLALLLTRLVAVRLRHAFEGGGQSRADLVGLVCVVRTGHVDQGFGQAEVTSADGSSALVQVRQAGEDPLTSGSNAVIYDYDAAGEFFWISPVDLDSTRD